MFRSLACYALCATFCLANTLFAGDQSTEPADAVEFFNAMDAGDLGVRVIPRDAKRVNIQLENKTDRPLNIKLPESIGVVPVLAQPGNFFNNQGGNLLGGNQFGANQFGGNQGGAQGLGAPMANQNNNNMFPGAIFSVPPGRIIKKRLPALCLEFGKPEPMPRMAYRVTRLEELNDNDNVRQLIVRYGDGQISNKIAQIAAWHLANDLSWEQLVGLTHKRANGTTVPRFTSAEIDKAKWVVKHLAKRTPESPLPKSESSGDQGL